MHVLLPLVLILFIAPILIRFATRGAFGSGIGMGVLAEMKAGIRQPAMVLHTIGGLVVLGGLGFAFTRGKVARAISFDGVIGATIVVVGAVLMAWSLAVLRSWRLLPQVDAGHQLCTTGPYAIVRHPIYLAIDLAAVGAAICVPTVPIVVGAILMIAGGDARARAEEKELLAAFGSRYRDYMARVSRLLPGIYWLKHRNIESPEKCEPPRRRGRQQRKFSSLSLGVLGVLAVFPMAFNLFGALAFGQPSAAP